MLPHPLRRQTCGLSLDHRHKSVGNNSWQWNGIGGIGTTKGHRSLF